MNMKRNSLLVAVFVLLATWFVPAQESNRVLFKSMAPEASKGATFIFSLYDQADGTKLLEVTQTVTALGRGRFFAILDVPEAITESNPSLYVSYAAAAEPGKEIGNGTITLRPVETQGGEDTSQCVLCYSCGGNYPNNRGTLALGEVLVD